MTFLASLLAKLWKPIAGFLFLLRFQWFKKKAREEGERANALSAKVEIMEEHQDIDEGRRRNEKELLESRGKPGMFARIWNRGLRKQDKD